MEKATQQKTLATQLTEQLTDLREKYVAQALKYAEAKFNEDVDFVSNYTIGHTFADERKFYRLPSIIHSAHNARLRKDEERFNNYLAQHKAKAEKNAHRHVDQSIEKLAARIIKKGLDLSRVEVSRASVGVNIECRITDGSKTVNAWTIIAWGEIQRPHYRFLIK